MSRWLGHTLRCPLGSELSRAIGRRCPEPSLAEVPGDSGRVARSCEYRAVNLRTRPDDCISSRRALHASEDGTGIVFALLSHVLLPVDGRSIVGKSKHQSRPEGSPAL